jgi:hypothetical protein
MAKRTTITNGIRPFRFLFVVLIVLSFIDALKNPASQASLIVWIVSVVLFGVLHFSRKVEFDDQTIYRAFRSRDRPVPFTQIESVKQNGFKVNDTQMWKVTYLDNSNQERSFQFFEGVFQQGSANKFIRAVSSVKPSAIA